MKSQAEIEMEWTQAEVRRLEKELSEAKQRADAAWRAYVRDLRPNALPRASGQEQ